MPDPRESHPDLLASGLARGRGAQLNPANRFEDVRLHVLGEHLDDLARACPEALSRGVQLSTRVHADESRSIINRVDSPDIPFNWTVNIYRVCEHGCIYCYARPGHEYLGLSCGLDFETRIHAKPDAPRLLREALADPKWTGETIVFSGVTDCYQPVERELGIMRECLLVCREFNQSLSIITKNAMILRDLDLISEMATQRLVRTAISITTLDNDLASKMEPRASAPHERLRAVRELARAGVPVAVMVAPIIPAINDREIPAILARAADAGAHSAGWVLLKLPHQIKALFLDWLGRHFPDRAEHVESLIRGTRGGQLYDARSFVRMKGEGAFAQQIARVFQVFAARYKLDRAAPTLNTRAFRRPHLPGGQLPLFGT